ncbi:Vacuolar protein sorting-associated protein 11 [Tilletia horrida]|nr:Vacuolar protein sorting-associated protein 11 [Tilletia horrida]
MSTSGGGGAGAAPAWRQFNFYESSLIRDSADYSSTPIAFRRKRSTNEIAAIATSIIRPPLASTTNAPCVLIADIDGHVNILDPLQSYSELASFQAFESGRITHLSTDAHGRIITLGELDLARFPILRIWDIRTQPTVVPAKINIADAAQNQASTLPPPPPTLKWRPRLLGEARVQHGSRPQPIAAISHTPSLSYLAVALADGTVLLMRNVDTALLSSGGTISSSNGGSQSPSAPVPAVTLPKFKVIASPEQHSDPKASLALDPVTALGFSESGAQTISTSADTTNAAAEVTRGPAPGAEPRRQRNRGRGAASGVTGTSRSNTVIDPTQQSSSQAQSLQPRLIVAGPTTVHLFITTLSRTLRYTVLGPGAGATPAIVDDVGCALGCAALVIPPTIPPIVSSTSGASSTSATALLATSTVLGGGAGSGAGSGGGSSAGAKMVLARDEAVYVVGAEGREAAYANEGPKAFVRLHPSSQQLIIVSPPFTPTSASHSATVRQYVARGDGGGGNKHNGEIAKLTVFDLDNRFVAYSGTFEGGIRDVWIEPYASPSAVAAVTASGTSLPTSGQSTPATKPESDGKASSSANNNPLMSLGGDIVVLGDDGSLTRLTEKPLRDKLDIFFRKFLFLLAVGTSKTHASRASAAAYSRALASYSAGSQGTSKSGTAAAGAAVSFALAAAQEVASRVEPMLGDIYRRYGDHLYEKGDFYGSVAQYVKTVGWVQPSYIIRKFLDAQRIQHLTTYLEALHAGGLANSDHTTLLLNCYTKLKDVKSLDRFIKHPPNLNRSSEDDGQVGEDGEGAANAGAATADDLPFDLDTAIRVCRQAGYFGHAAYLAERYEQHEEYLRIQIEDGKGYGEALDYIRRLDADEAERHLARYARVLLSELPERTTDLLIEICSGTFRKAAKVDVHAAANEAGKGSKSTATGYLSLLQYGKSGGTSANGRKQSLAGAETSGAKSLKGGAAIGTTASSINSPFTSEPFDFLEDGPIGEAPSYFLPSPRPFFAHFIQHQRQFIRFLETVALRRWGQSVSLDLSSLDADRAAHVRDLRERQRERIAAGLDESDPDVRDQRAVWNTLLELYLSAASQNGAATNAQNGRRDSDANVKALAVLKQYEYLPYDNTQAVLLCSTNDFNEGLFFLYERMGMYEDILRYWMDLEAEQLKNGGTESKAAVSGGENVMACLNTYGGAHPHLYPIVLRWLVSDERVLAAHRKDFAEVLSHIEEEDLMGPLEVVKALANSNVANLGLVKEYLLRAITQERDEIDADRRLTNSYREETSKKLAELSELSDPKTTHVFQTTKCSSCGGQLDLPTVHFLCKHSYHQRCLGETEPECPNCARAYGVIRDIRRNNEAFADRHDIFMAEVEEAEDGFGAVANMFSKGLFSARQLGQAN